MSATPMTLPSTNVSLPATVPNTKDVSSKSLRRGRGRPPVPATEVAVMRKLREAGHTLQRIAYFTERCVPTVMKYTAAVPHPYRQDKPITINRRTGLVVAK